MRPDRSTLVGWHLTTNAAGTKQGRSRPKSRAKTRSKSRSKSPSKRRSGAPKQKLKCLYEIGTLGSTFDGLSLGGSLGHGGTMQFGSTVSYTQQIRKRFKTKPRTYNKIVQTLGDVQDDGADKLEIIKRIIVLLDGHPDLILGFNAYLPEEYSIEIQDDAVVVKVFEASNTAREHVDTGHFRSEQQMQGSMELSRTFSGMLTGNSLSYVQNIKDTFKDDPAVYRKFSRILGDYHSNEVDVVSTLYEIVSLFQHHPDNVLGFNTFLPPGYSVRMTEKTAYMLEYPGPGDGSTEYTRINIEDRPDSRRKGRMSIKFKE